MKETQIPTERQLTAEEIETLQLLFPSEEALEQAFLSPPTVSFLEQGRTSSAKYFKDPVPKCTAKESLPRGGQDRNGWIL